MIKLLALSMLFLVCKAFSQSPVKSPAALEEPGQQPYFSSGQNCENTAASMSPLVQHVPVDKNIIVVAYRGKTETVDIVARRLHNAKQYLTEYFRRSQYARSPEKVITAIGTARTDEGAIEFYVDGVLKLGF